MATRDYPREFLEFIIHQLKKVNDNRKLIKRNTLHSLMVKTISEMGKELEKFNRGMVTKQKLSQALETIAVGQNKETMAQIAASGSDIIASRVQEINSINDL